MGILQYKTFLEKSAILARKSHLPTSVPKQLYTVLPGICLEIAVHAVSFLFVPTALRSVEDDEQEDLKVRDIESGQMEQIQLWLVDQMHF